MIRLNVPAPGCRGSWRDDQTDAQRGGAHVAGVASAGHRGVAGRARDLFAFGDAGGGVVPAAVTKVDVLMAYLVTLGCGAQVLACVMAIWWVFERLHCWLNHPRQGARSV